MDERPWSLPGPSLWLEHAIAGLSRGIVLLEVPEARSIGLSQAFEAAALSARFASSGFVRLGAAHLDLPPASAILEAALPPDLQPASPSAAGIAGNADMDGMVIWVELPHDLWRRWSVFAGSFLAAREASKLLDPPAIVILARPEAPSLDPRIKPLRFEGEIGRDDASLVFAEAGRGRSKSRLERLLAAELVIELAGWDLELVRELAALKLEELLDPVEWANGRYANSTKLARWADGTLDFFEGRSFPSFTTLIASGDTDAVRRRVWRAQVRGLYPWLEDIRQAVLDRFDGKFRLPLKSYDDTMITDPAGLEWGQIQYALKGRASDEDMAFFGVMKKVRNQLAHRKPVIFTDLVEAEQLARKYDPDLCAMR